MSRPALATSRRAPAARTPRWPLTTLVALTALLVACGDDPAAGGADAQADGVDTAVTDAGDTAQPSDTSVLGDTVAPVDVSAEVDACRGFLEDGQPYMALQQAEAALERAPDDVEANFCAALAGIIDRTEFGLSLFKVLDMASTYNGLVVYEPTYSDTLAEELHGIFGYLHEGYALAVERLDRIRDAELAFDVALATVQDGPKPLLAHRGRFDRGDVLLTRAIARFAVGLIDILHGQDFRGDVATLIAFVADEGIGGGFDLSTLSEVLGYLLATDERFLTLHPEDGEAAFLEAREILADLGPDMREALAVIEAQQPTAGVDEVSWAEARPDGGYLLKVRSRVVTGDSGPREEEIAVELSAPVLAGLDLISTSVRQPGELVPWEGGLTVLLALIVNQLIETGALSDLSIGGVELPPGLFTVEQLANLLAALIPSPAAFDMGTFYANPVGLRAILPLGEARGGFGHDRLMASWECPDDLGADGFPSGAQRFVCSSDANVTDAPHFVGTPHELPADGYASGFPVMAWQDPTWNGLLYVDLSEVLPDTPPGYVPTDAVTINVLLAEMLTPLFDLIGD